MPIHIEDTRAIVRRSRSIADNADFLSFALAKGDTGQTEAAVDDLLAAYDSYGGQAKAYSGRLGFDEVAALAEPMERDQSVAQALASALIDLEVALVLGRAAQATGEIEGQASVADLDESVGTLKETLAAIEKPSGAAARTTRFAFDEVTVSSAPAALSSPDPATAKASYEQQVSKLYDTLIKETYDVLTAAFESISKLDADKINEAINAIAGPIDLKLVGRLAARVLEAVERAIETIKGILGAAPLGPLGERINKILAELRQGENIARLFLKYIYDFDGGKNKIAEWLKKTQVDQATIDRGTQTLADLQQQVIQAFALQRRIIASLRLLSSPIEFILKRFGGTLPLDMILASAFVLVIDVALLRGMDYADTTQIIKWVDGVVVMSKRTLGIS